MKNLQTRKKKKLLFLYTELAGYFLACLKTLIRDHDVQVHVVRFPVNKEAPFLFDPHPEIFFYERKNYSCEQLKELVMSIDPDFIYCSGWIDKDYVKICKKFKNKISTVLAVDNQWKNSVKQIIGTVLFRGHIKKTFSHIWIPGSPQFEYARRLGFKKDAILMGVYSIDFELFNKEYEKNKNQKQINFPKRFLYVGRYYEFKGVKDLWEVFLELQNENPNNWELWCAGTGNLDKNFPGHPKIKNLGFIQPDKIVDVIGETGVFVLPSHFEPWGVVVHEFAAAGMPLICSDEVGSVSQFVKDNFNGFVHRTKDKNSLKSALRKMMSFSGKEMTEMGERSVDLAKQNTPKIWADTLMKLFN